MKSVKRRELLKLSVIGCAITLAGCGGSDEGQVSEAAASPPVTPSAVWDPSPSLVFTAGTSNVKIDLANTLPVGIKRGGVFSLATTSQALPSGVTLSAQGVVTVVNAAAGITSNIVFAYAEPA